MDQTEEIEKNQGECKIEAVDVETKERENVNTIPRR